MPAAQPPGPDPLSRRIRPWAIGVVIAVVATYVVVLVVMGVLGSAGIVGRAGVTVDGAGNPVIVITACGGAEVREVYLLGKEPQDHTPVRSHPRAWTAGGPATGVVELPLVGDVPSPWARAEKLAPLRADYIYIADGAADGGNRITQVSFRLADLAQLRPGQVKVDYRGVRIIAEDELLEALC